MQVAKALGGVVTAVCSSQNVDTARSLGADRVCDYGREDFTRSDERYDLMIDIAGSRSWSECARVLIPDATVVVVGGPKSNRLLGPLGHAASMRLRSLVGGRKTVFFIAQFNKPDMQTLRELMESGRMRSVIDRRHAFGEVAEALSYVGDGHARGKIVVDVAGG